MNDKEFLEHVGILGMHWGRRKGASTNPVKQHNASEDHNKKLELKDKKLHQLTNDELRMYTQRMSLEKSYKELSKNDISAGKKLINEMLNSAKKGATDAAMKYINAQGAKMVDELLKKATKKATT